MFLYHRPLRYPSNEGRNIARSALTKMWGGFCAYVTSADAGRSPSSTAFSLRCKSRHPSTRRDDRSWPNPSLGEPGVKGWYVPGVAITILDRHRAKMPVGSRPSQVVHQGCSECPDRTGAVLRLRATIGARSFMAGRMAGPWDFPARQLPRSERSKAAVSRCHNRSVLTLGGTPRRHTIKICGDHQPDDDVGNRIQVGGNDPVLPFKKVAGHC